MKYRKLPVEIEAMRVPLTRDGSVGSDMERWGELETWLGPRGGWNPLRSGRVEIKTLEGTMVANPGDWIVRGVQGELYPCKADIFEATYEPAE